MKPWHIVGYGVFFIVVIGLGIFSIAHPHAQLTKIYTFLAQAGVAMLQLINARVRYLQGKEVWKADVQLGMGVLILLFTGWSLAVNFQLGF